MVTIFARWLIDDHHHSCQLWPVAVTQRGLYRSGRAGQLLTCDPVMTSLRRLSPRPLANLLIAAFAGGRRQALFTCNLRVCQLDGRSLNVGIVRHRCWKQSVCRCTTKEPRNTSTVRTYGRSRADRWSNRSRCVDCGTVPSAVLILRHAVLRCYIAPGVSNTANCAGIHKCRDQE